MVMYHCRGVREGVEELEKEWDKLLEEGAKVAEDEDLVVMVEHEKQSVRDLLRYLAEKMNTVSEEAKKIM